MFVDAHAHLDKYSDLEILDVFMSIDREQILTVSVSVDVASFSRTERIAEQSDLIIAAFGIHPSEAHRLPEDLPLLQPYADRSLVIGEIGLEYRFVTDSALYPAQQRTFAWFLEHAAEHNKPIIVHCVGAERDTAAMIVEYGIERVIIHWYSGPLDVLDEMIDAGFSFSIGFEVIHSDHIRAITAAIPDRQLPTETDNPGGPQWLTGDWSYPHLIGDMVDEIAVVRGVHRDDLLAMVPDNMARIID
jgi:TatD DNase family protein